MAKLCIALGLCAAAAFFSLSQFASRRGRGDDVKALCSWLTRAGVPDRVRHWALTSPLLHCVENLKEQQEKEVAESASSFIQEDKDLYTTAASSSTQNPHDSSYEEYDDTASTYGTRAPEHLQEYQTGWEQKIASPKTRTTAQLEDSTIGSSWSHSSASNQEPEKATYSPRLSKTTHDREVVTTNEPLFTLNQHGDMRLVQTTETVTLSSNDQLEEATIPFYDTGSEDEDKRSATTSNTVPELTREYQVTSPSSSLPRTPDVETRHTTNPALTTTSVEPYDLDKETAATTEVLGTRKGDTNENPETTTLESTTQMREMQGLSDSSPAPPPTIIYKHATETIYFPTPYAPNSQNKLALISEAGNLHLDDPRSEPTAVRPLSSSPSVTTKHDDETTTINFSNANSALEQQEYVSSTSSAPFLLDRDTYEVTSTTPSVYSATQETKQTTTMSSFTELDLPSSNKAKSTAGSHSIPYTADNENNIGTSTTLAKPGAENRDETTKNMDSERLQKERAEKTLNFISWPDSFPTWHDKGITPTTIARQSTLEDSAEATVSTKLNLPPKKPDEQTLNSAPLSEYSMSWQSQDPTLTTTEAQSTAEARVGTTSSTSSDLSQHPEEQISISIQKAQPSASWEDLGTTYRADATPVAVQDDVEAAVTTNLPVQSEQQEENKWPFAAGPESSTSWQDLNTTPKSTAPDSVLEGDVEAATNAKLAVGSQHPTEKTFTPASLYEPSTSWKDQDTSTRSTETQTTAHEDVEATITTEMDFESKQQEQDESSSGPVVESSTSMQYQNIPLSTVATQSSLEDRPETSTDTKLELKSEERAEHSASLFELSTSLQDDTESETATAQYTAENRVETITSAQPIFLTEERSKESVTSAQLSDFSTPNQDQGITPTTVTLSSVKDIIEMTTTNEPIVEEPEGPKIVCYFTSWSMYRDDRGRFTPEDIDPKLCTHIMYAFATLDATTLKISMADRWADEDFELYKRVTALKAANRRLKVLLSLGGSVDSDGLDQKYSRLAANATARHNFARHAASFLVKHRFDGLDVDWEFPNCKFGVCPSNPPDKENFVLLLQDLREAFAEYSPPLLLTAALSGDIEVIEEAYLVPDIFKQLDFASIMAYDYYGAWSTIVGHYAPLQSAMDETNPEISIEYVVNTLLAMGAPASQLVLGVPFYASSFTLANPRLNDIGSPSKGAGKPGPVTDSPGVLSYYEICSAIKAGGWSTMMDPRAGVYAFSGDQWVCFDGPRSVTRKARFAQKMNLAGLMVWDLSMDDFRGECGRIHPLLSAAHRALYPPPATPADRG